jgi:ferredoxin-nitrite reductase
VRQEAAVNKIEAMKAEKDGLDVLPDLLRYAAEGTPVEQVPEGDLDRMKWYGVFHRKQTPGFFMMRLRIPGGRLTSVQAEAIADIARDFGRGAADITTRQNIQLRWLTLAVIPEILRRLAAVGLSSQQTGMDNVRNLIGCPLAGIDGEEVIDTTPILLDLQRAWLGRHVYSNLPRKFNLSIAGCRQDCGHAQTQDLGFQPATLDVDGVPTVGFNVLVGGALGGTSPRLATPLDVWVPPEQVTPFTLALLAVYRDHGPREQRTKARLKWLIAEWGEERLRAAVERQLEQPLRRAGTPATEATAGDHLGVHRQAAGDLSYVGVHVPVGRISADQLTGIARIASRYGSGELRLTIDQNLVIPDVTDDRLAPMLAEPLLRELSPNPSGIWRNLVCCTGNDYCHFSLIDTKNRAIELARTLEERGVRVAEGTRINISGCVHACGKHHIADLGLVGANVRVGDQVEEAVDVYAGGRLGADGRLAVRERRDVLMSELPVLAEAILCRTEAGERLPITTRDVVGKGEEEAA